MPEPRYKFIVGHFKADGQREWVINTAVAEEAFAHFISSLRDVGHDSHRIESAATQLTIIMMDGRDGLTVLDPDLLGQTSITRIATN